MMHRLRELYLQYPAIVLIVPMLLGFPVVFLANRWAKRVTTRYPASPTACNLDGGDVARKMLENNLKRP
jgi:hypothetical protein